MSGPAGSPARTIDDVITCVRLHARMHGYAVGVHGTLRRDIDLIAVAWVPTADPAAIMVESVRKALCRLTGSAVLSELERGYAYFQDGCPGAKPFGRLAWAFHMPGLPYLDLSVIPPTDPVWPKVEHRSDPAPDGAA